MSLIFYTGGTGYVAGGLRIAAVSYAAYHGLSWLNRQYGIEVLNPMPHRVLAAAVTGFACELALRSFSDTNAYRKQMVDTAMEDMKDLIKDKKIKKKDLKMVKEALGINDSQLESIIGILNEDEKKSMVDYIMDNQKQFAELQALLTEQFKGSDGSTLEGKIKQAFAAAEAQDEKRLKKLLKAMKKEEKRKRAAMQERKKSRGPRLNPNGSGSDSDETTEDTDLIKARKVLEQTKRDFEKKQKKAQDELELQRAELERLTQALYAANDA